MDKTKLLIVHRPGLRSAHHYWESAEDWAEYAVQDNGVLVVARPDGRKVQYARGYWTRIETKWVEAPSA